MMTQNIEEAKKLLAEAGFPDGIDIEIFCKPDPTWERAAVEAMVEQWKPAGIRAKINILPSSQVLGSLDQCAVRLHRVDASAAGLHGAGARLPHRRAVERDRLFEQEVRRAAGQGGRQRSMSTARAEIIGELEKIMQEDGPIAQPLWRSVFTDYDKRVRASRSIRRSISSARSSASRRSPARARTPPSRRPACRPSFRPHRHPRESGESDVAFSLATTAQMDPRFRGGDKSVAYVSAHGPSDEGAALADQHRRRCASRATASFICSMVSGGPSRFRQPNTCSIVVFASAVAG